MTLLDRQSAHASAAPQEWGASGWKLGEVIGRGSYATVYRGQDTRTGRSAALKVISKEHEDNTTEAIAGEIRVLRAVSTSLRYSSDFVKLQAVYEDPFNVYLLLDLCHGGTLAERMVQQPAFSELEAQQVARQLLRALHQLHSLNLVHCDIKPENVMFARPDSLHDLKIADFGLSQSAYTDTDYSVMGSPFYVAPEVLNRQLYSPSCDVWATGILLYKMLCGRVPFPTEEKIKQNQLRFYDEVWASISQDAKTFIAACLTKDHKERLSISDLLKHPWVASAALGAPDLLPPPTKEMKQVAPVKAMLLDPTPSSPKRVSTRLEECYMSSDDDDFGHWDIAARNWAPSSPLSPSPTPGPAPGRSNRKQKKMSIDRRLSLMLLGRGLR